MYDIVLFPSRHVASYTPRNPYGHCITDDGEIKRHTQQAVHTLIASLPSSPPLSNHIHYSKSHSVTPRAFLWSQTEQCPRAEQLTLLAQQEKITHKKPPPGHCNHFPFPSLPFTPLSSRTAPSTTRRGKPRNLEHGKTKPGGTHDRSHEAREGGLPAGAGDGHEGRRGGGAGKAAHGGAGGRGEGGGHGGAAAAGVAGGLGWDLGTSVSLIRDGERTRGM